MLRAVLLIAGLQSLPTGALGQGVFGTFSADAAVAIDVRATGEAGARAGAENRAAAEVSGEVEVTVTTSGRSTEAVPVLERQDLRPVGTFIRTCDCEKVKTVVRTSSYAAPLFTAPTWHAWP